MRIFSRPSYLAPPSTLPERVTRAEQHLIRLRQATAAADLIIEDMEEALNGWNLVSKEEKAKATDATGICAEDLAKAAADLIAAKPQGTPAPAPKAAKTEPIAPVKISHKK